MFKPQVSKRRTIPIPSIFVFAVLPLVVTLTGAHLAQAGGFNVDSLVTFTPLASTYRTVANAAGCPAGFAGKFTFTALLTNRSDSPAMPGLDVLVQTLTNGNLLLDPQTNAVLGGQGAVMEIPQVGQYADGLLSADETVDVHFVVCLKTRQSFQFFVDVFGVVTELVNINLAGTGSGASPTFALSADGRFVAFQSSWSDLVATDTNGMADVFVRDLQTGTTTLVSINRAGTDSGNRASRTPAISADGRFVAFISVASDLVATDTNGADDLFVRDLQTGTTTLVSVNRFGTNSGNGASDGSVISADGRFVAFTSAANDLVIKDSNGTTDVFVRDLQVGTTSLVSVNRFGFDLFDSGNGASGESGALAISADGRFVAFGSFATDLVPTDTNAVRDVFVRDLQTGTTTLVSVNRFGTNSGNGASGGFEALAISADGRFVAFQSRASDLVATDTNGADDIFVRDLQADTTTLVSANLAGTDSGRGNQGGSTGASISADGRFVAFTSWAPDLVATDTNGTRDVFVRDLQAETTTLVSVNLAGTDSGRGTRPGPPLQGGSFATSISADGRFVAFTSYAQDLVATDGNGESDVFVHDLETRTTTLASVNWAGTDSVSAATGSSLASALTARLSADGRFVAFLSYADLVANDTTNGTTNLFVRPVP